MLFHSYQFLIFLAIVAIVHQVLAARYRWAALLAASYVFYGAWRVEYLALIIASTLIDYTVGRSLERYQSPTTRNLLLAASLCLNLGLLFTFKYFNFLADSAEALANALGMDYLAPHLEVLLPVGISFYTFQTLSYTIDRYRNQAPAEKHLGRFALFVAFFPQLVAGPIERASRLLPQLAETRSFEYARVRSGLLLMLYGFFKKVVIADRLAVAVNFIYANPERCPGPVLFIGTIFFAFQIYCDFSGYTDIARGCARLFGVELMKNFDRPYFATSIADFWRRWHLSLTTWFRDYVYIPLGGNRAGRRRWVIAVLAVFLVSGLWHGANWTFVAWGAIHAAAYLGERGLGLDSRGRTFDKLQHFVRILVTFTIVTIAWVFFRAESVGHATQIIGGMTQNWQAIADSAVLNDLIQSMDLSTRSIALSIALIALLIAIEARLRDREFEDVVTARPAYQRWLIYIALSLAIMNLGTLNEIPFVYYQF